ncbi:hypothetical protein GGR56DRAFT_296664 [Xylariaceae sp. FL0804]|nr:hypothetical protein GGR56DRAFT_296664 [Xylariaceae sp. FL0804]
MASHFHVQKPYVLATLPRPLDPTTGRYIVGEVYGSHPGSRKRKRRPELTVGIDGEAVNIYDVSSARLVTSYPIPPQTRISCPVYSVRRRAEGSKDIARYTYAAVEDSSAHKVTLFKDHVEASGKTTSTSQSFILGDGSPVVCLAPISSPLLQVGASEAALHEDILAVREDGRIICLDAETLKQKWSHKSTVLQQDLGDDANSNFKVEYCRSASAAEVISGIFKGNSEAFGMPLAPEDDHADIFVLISSSGQLGQGRRHLHVFGLLPPAPGSVRAQQGISQFYAVPLASSSKRGDDRSYYRLDVRNGTLLELRGQHLSVHDLRPSIPKITSTVYLEYVTSFMNLSKTSLLCAASTQLRVYNPVYMSLQDTVDMDLESTAQAREESGKVNTTCSLVAYFSALELAVAIVDSSLVAIQLEAPKKRNRKQRVEGLLIDSIGRGLAPSSHKSTRTSAALSSPPKHSAFSNFIPGSIRGNYWETWAADEANADALLNDDKIYELEAFLAGKFGIQTTAPDLSDNQNVVNGSSGFPTWYWPKSRAAYPPVDRRWVLYAISRAFQWNDALPNDQTVPRLICQLPQSNIVNYLVDAGHLTLSNVKAAFRGKLNDKEQADTFLAEQLISKLADADPSLEFVVAYLSATNVGAVELLLVVRTIMRSLELVQDPKKPPPKLLTDGSIEQPVNGEIAGDGENLGMEIDDLEDEILKTVSYLNEDSGIRGSGLSVAFAKLGTCPGVSMVKALRSVFKPEEILSLVYLLRVELVKGAWTAKYLDETEFERDAALDAPPDGVIKLIADLLGRCVDSIGPGGWLLNDAILAGDESGDFVASLKLEVSAALEGIEEAVYLRGIVGEAVRFCESSSRKKSAAGGEGGGGADTTRPNKSLHVREPGSEALPLGLANASQQTVSRYKVVSGGEVVERSLREIGHLIGQQVGAYSLEGAAS